MLAVVGSILAAVVAAAAWLVRGTHRQRSELSTAAHRSVAEYYVRTLRQAAELAGGEAELAARLEVPPEALRRWLEGAESPPMEVHLAALDVVTKRLSRES